MARLHLIRIGAMGQVGRFRALDARRYPRGSRVIVRTERGLEIGEVLAPPAGEVSARVADGTLIRGMTIEDQLLEARLLKNRDAAYDACQRRIEEFGLDATLLDVEHLFDGQSLYFYFLGETTPELEKITEELAEVYETQVQFRAFTETVVNGCGPACGTDAATGAGCTSCATGCAVAGACAARVR